MSTLASVFGYGLLSARPAAAVAGRFYYGTDTSFMYRDNGASWDTLAVGAGSMATDVIWAAAGDLVIGTGSHTAAKYALVVPAANVLNVLAVANGETTPTWKALFDATAPSTQALGDAASPGTSLIAAHRDHKHAMPAASSLAGYEYDYVEKTSGTSITATAEASANTIVTGAAVSYDGSTIVKIEFFCGSASSDSSATSPYIQFDLYDGSGSIGHLGFFRHQGVGVGEAPLTMSRRLTPSNASHTYSIRAHVSGGTGQVNAGAGGSGNDLPCYMRITRV